MKKNYNLQFASDASYDEKVKKAKKSKKSTNVKSDTNQDEFDPDYLPFDDDDYFDDVASYRDVYESMRDW